MYRYRPDPLAHPRRLLARGRNGQNRQDDVHVGLIVLVAIAGAFFVSMTTYCALRSIRRRHDDPKYIPTSYLKNAWTRWGAPGRGTYEPAADAGPAPQAEPSASAARGPAGDAGSAGATATASAQVDRNTSIRSVMTLPPYRLDPTNAERVIGREGERDGVDVVIEMPTEENLESLREEEMESLYRIRLARRQQTAEREQRREARREARGRNDAVALGALPSRSAAAGVDRSVLDELRREHALAKDQRAGAVSSVSYADLGVARHDGTRIRANSAESERVGLLSDAASITLSTPSGDTRRSSTPLRDRSDSALSVSADFPPPPSQPQPSLRRGSRASSRAGSARRRLSAHARTGSGSDVAEADVADSAMIPAHPPPDYEDGPSDFERPATPVAEPPPDYPGRDPSPGGGEVPRWRSGPPARRDVGGRGVPRSGVGGAPQLPSLRLGSVPQIVIEPSQDQPR